MSPTVNALPALPEQIISFDGQKINISQSVWRIRSAAEGGKIIRFNWDHLRQLQVEQQSVYGQRAFALIQLYISDCLTRRKATTASVYYASFIKFGRWLAEQPKWWAKVGQPAGFEWSSYDEGLARVWLAWGIEHTASNGDYFRHLRIFYHWGLARQYPEFSLEMDRILQTIKPKLHSVGHHVRFRHPTKGPFSAAEKRAIIQALQAEQGEVTDRILVMLHLELGLNPKASGWLLNRDFKQMSSPSGTVYQLDVPRIKKRNAVRETRRRPISPRLGCLLNQLKQGSGDDPLLYWLSPNGPESDILTRMKRWVKAVQLVSPRTGEVLNISPRRFRYTLATHLAEEGASRYHLAVVLDHTDLNYVDLYAQTTATIATQVAEATDTALTPLVNRFLGKVIDSLSTPAFPHLPINQVVPAAMPHIPLLSTAGVGVCGRDFSQQEPCHLFPPLSCYLCPSFAALKDGPHREILHNIETYLTEHQDRLDQRLILQFNEVRQALQALLSQVEALVVEVSS